MYQNLGVQWASSIPAFLSLACVPFPLLFYKYGLRIRERCKYAAEAKRASDALEAATRSAADTTEEAPDKHAVSGLAPEQKAELGGASSRSTSQSGTLNGGRTPDDNVNRRDHEENGEKGSMASF